MNVIYVMADSMRRDHVSVYGNPPWGRGRTLTPNLQRFAAAAQDLHGKMVAFMRQQGIKEDFIAGYKAQA